MAGQVCSVSPDSEKRPSILSGLAFTGHQTAKGTGTHSFVCSESSIALGSENHLRINKIYFIIA